MKWKSHQTFISHLRYLYLEYFPYTQSTSVVIRLLPWPCRHNTVVAPDDKDKNYLSRSGVKNVRIYSKICIASVKFSHVRSSKYVVKGDISHRRTCLFCVLSRQPKKVFIVFVLWVFFVSFYKLIVFLH